MTRYFINEASKRPSNIMSTYLTNSYLRSFLPYCFNLISYRKKIAQEFNFMVRLVRVTTVKSRAPYAE